MPYFFQSALAYTLQKYAEKLIKILMLLKPTSVYSTCHGEIKWASDAHVEQKEFPEVFFLTGGGGRKSPFFLLFISGNLNQPTKEQTRSNCSLLSTA